jgi:hypothetical protein
MSEQQVVVTVDDRHLTMIEDVAAGLRAVGLRVQQINRTTGTIIGSVAVDRRADLDVVQGVASIRPVTGFRVAPPDADVQ